MDQKQVAEDIFLSAVRSVTPSVLIPSVFSLDNNVLRAGNITFQLNEIRNIYVIGAGKASAAMAAEVEKILGDRIEKGHIIVKYGHSCRLKRIKVTEAGHPVPDRKGFKATRSLLEIAAEAGEGDLVICLISGGGSALLADFPEGSSAKEIIRMNELLVNCGAGISEINAVRKHTSYVKGGQLARTVFPATLLNLVLSDVPGDPLDVIASGPTVPDPSTFNQALEVLRKYDLVQKIPENILQHLHKGINGLIPETPKSGDIVFSKTINLLIGTNKVALEAAVRKAFDYNINALIIDTKLQGDVSSVADYVVETAVRFRKDENEVKPVCLLFGGETTVKMTGKGKGGRNQHLALLVSLLLRDLPEMTFLSGGTDGNDGPTDAAGAIVDSDTYLQAISEKIIPEKYIEAFNSYNFFRKAGGHVITGPTMTNVMDVMVMIVR
jgi:glycerate-2-kinase